MLDLRLITEWLAHGRCRWIDGDATALMRAGINPYCGAPTVAGTAWCEEHYRRVHLKVYVLQRHRADPFEREMRKNGHG